MSEEVARRCTTCGLSFTIDPRWETCAKCGEKTDLIGAAEANTTDKEATSLLRAREFQEYLDKEGIK